MTIFFTTEYHHVQLLHLATSTSQDEVQEVDGKQAETSLPDFTMLAGHRLRITWL